MTTPPQERLSRRNVILLATVSCAQLLVILDTTIVNVAIPFAARDLEMGEDGRQWIITAYALAFGALLLVGGRVADYWGRKRTFLLGVLLFAGASIWGGASTTGFELLAARALQGAGAAMMAPAALSILTTSFPGGRPRTVAFGVVGAITSSGAAVGVILGGAITEFAGWRWCLYVNAPLAAMAAVAGLLVLRESRASGKARYDLWGAITVSLGLTSVVFGLTRAEESLFQSGAVPLIALGLLFLFVFVLIERKADSPLLPLKVVLHRTRGGAFVAQLFAGAAMTGVILYNTLFLQQVLGFGPLAAGFAGLPLALAIALSTPVVIGVVHRIGLKAVLMVGAATAATGVALLSLLAPTATYPVAVLPGLIIMGVGMAGVFAAAQNLALSGVETSNAGAASAAANATSQIGGAVGLAILTNAFIAIGSQTQDSATAAYTAAFGGASCALALIVVLAGLLIRGPSNRSVDGEQ